MIILLKDIWSIEETSNYKIHFARYGGYSQPLDVFVRNRDEWQGWQEYKPKRNDFNQQFIFSLMQFYHESETWLFGGIYEVLERHSDCYSVRLTEQKREFIGHLKIKSDYKQRATRTRMEPYYSAFEVKEILTEPYNGRQFPGYDNVHLSFEELETLIQIEHTSWKTALENIKGIYLITDISNRKFYVGSAYGNEGVWSRWKFYIMTGDGGNKGINEHLEGKDLEYCRKNFYFTLLEHYFSRVSDDQIIMRENFWKEVLISRKIDGLNKN